MLVKRDASGAKLFKQDDFTDAGTFLQALLPTGLFAAHTPRRNARQAHSWIFRGQGDAAWQLKPKVFRDTQGNKNSNMGAFAKDEWEPAIRSDPDGNSDELGQARRELEAIVEFAVHADKAGLPYPVMCQSFAILETGQGWKISTSRGFLQLST